MEAINGDKLRGHLELLAHFSAVFEEELAVLGDDRAALERTAGMQPVTYHQ